MSLEELLDTARQTNKARDAIDRDVGHSPPNLDTSEGRQVLLSNAIAAIRAGLQASDWGCVAEGYLMLEELSKRLRADGDPRVTRSSLPPVAARMKPPQA